MSDDDGRQRRAPVRAAAGFAVAALAAAGFATVYVLGDQVQLEGLTLAISTGGLAYGLAVWARYLLPTGGYVEEHPSLRSSVEERGEFAEQFRADGPPRPRRRGLLAMLGLSFGTLAIALLFPIRSMWKKRTGSPAEVLRETPWGLGNLRLVTAEGEPLRTSDVSAESVVKVFPEGHEDSGDSAAFLVRIPRDERTAPPPAEGVGDVVAYSLLCTHAGCPVGVYEQGSGRITCPCHQSVFDLKAGAKPVGGPAARPLPGLPIDEGPGHYLRATGDLTAPPGPGYWGMP